GDGLAQESKDGASVLGMQFLSALQGDAGQLKQVQLLRIPVSSLFLPPIYSGASLMMNTSRDSSAELGKVLAWTSLLLAFGAVQGVIYLKAYWGRFGLNPFQYADVDSLALVGLTGIGVTLLLIGLGALFGGYIGAKIAAWKERLP